MKKLLMILTLLTTSSSFALTCTSEQDEGKKLLLTKLDSNLIEGKMIEDKISNIYAGSISIYQTYDLYTFFDDSGVKSTLQITKYFQPSGTCRARVCPDLYPNLKKVNGKLMIEGSDDEYFACL